MSIVHRAACEPSDSALATSILAWRHPRPSHFEGRCIGRTDVPVDPRKARRLARRIHRMSMRNGTPRVVCCSPLRRCRDVALHLRNLGWQVLVDPALLELDFGQWEGRLWRDISTSEVDAWVQDFAMHAPGGGEPLNHMLARAAAWVAPAADVTVVAHAGWMLARQWVMQHGMDVLPRPEQWPAAPRHGEFRRLKAGC